MKRLALIFLALLISSTGASAQTRVRVKVLASHYAVLGVSGKGRIVVQVRGYSPASRRRIITRRHTIRLFGLRAAHTYVVRVRASGRWLRAKRFRTLSIYEQARAPGAAPEPPMGELPEIAFSDYAYANNDPAAFWSDVHALGGSTVRVIVYWSNFQPTPDEPDYTTTVWKQLDRFVYQAKQEDLQVLVAMAAAPAWARRHDVGEKLGGAPRLGPWRDWIRLFSARYPYVHAYEWNEPNCCTLESYVPTHDLAQMLSAEYPILHAANPDVDVIAGSWCPCGAGGVTMHKALVELSKALRKGEDFDTFGYHMYPAMFGRKHGWEPGSSGLGNFTLGDLGKIVSQLDQYFPGQRVRFHDSESGWMTPGGYHGDALNEQCQASAYLWQLSEERRYTPRIIDMTIFKIRDQVAYAYTHNTYLTGFASVDGTHKLVWDRWISYLANPPSEYLPDCVPDKV